MQTPNPEYSSFLIRLWRELPASTEPSASECEWLVQVEHIPSGEKAYFTSLEEFFAFIRARVAGPHVNKGVAGLGGQST